MEPPRSVPDAGLSVTDGGLPYSRLLHVPYPGRYSVQYCTSAVWSAGRLVWVRQPLRFCCGRVKARLMQMSTTSPVSRLVPALPSLLLCFSAAVVAASRALSTSAQVLMCVGAAPAGQPWRHATRE
jgi:hypothetical protein